MSARERARCEVCGVRQRATTVGETYMTLNRRLVLLLLLDALIKTKTEQTGNFMIVDIFNAKKAVGQCGPCPGLAVQRDGRQYGPGSVALARCDYLLLRACDLTTTVARYDTNQYLLPNILQVDAPRCGHEGAWCWVCTTRQRA